MCYAKRLILVALLLTQIDAVSQEVKLPRFIDRSGKTDVSAEMNAFFEDLPDGSTVVFPKETTFRIEGIMTIRNKKHIVIKGNGSSIIAQTTGKDVPVPAGKPRHNWPRSRHHLSIENSQHISISDLKIKGAHASGGVHESAYVKELEAQHGVNIYGSRNITLDSMLIRNVYGDCIYIGDGAGKRSSDSIVISNSSFAYTGRQGIAITHGSFISILNSNFSDIRRTHIDLETNNSKASIQNVVIKNNTFLTSRLNWISAAGKGNTGNVFVIGNKLIGKEANVTLGNSQYKNFGPFYFINNSSSKPMGNPHGSAWRLRNVDGFYAEGNDIAVKKGRKMYLVGQSNSRNIVLKNNDSTDMVGYLKDL